MAWEFLRKRLVSICTYLVVVMAVIFAAVYLFAGRTLKFGIEKAGSLALGVPVTVKNVSLSMLRGNVSLRNLEIANPPGYTESDLMSMDQISASANIGQLLGDPVGIKRIDLDGITLVIEQKGLTNNMQQVLDNLADWQIDNGDADKDSDKTAKSKNLRIEVLEIRNVRVQIKLLPLPLALPGRHPGVQLNLAPIKMTQLGTDNKLSTAKLLGKIMFAIAEGIAEQGTDILPKEIIGPMRSVLSQGGSTLLKTGSSIIEKGKDIGEDAGKNILEGIGKALEGIPKKKTD